MVSKCQLNISNTDHSFLSTQASQLIRPKSDAEQLVKQFIDQHSLPPYATVVVSENTIIAEWVNMDWFRQNYPVEFHKDNWKWTPAEFFIIKFSQDQKPKIEIHYSGIDRDGYHGYSEAYFYVRGTLEGFDENGKMVLIIDPEIFDEEDNYNIYDDVCSN